MRLIDANALLQHKRKMSGADFSGEFWDEAVLTSDIKNATTVDAVPVVRCKDSVSVTNADRIRSMTDEELALWICGVYDIEEENGKFINGIIIPGYTPHDIEEWLQRPTKGG